MFVCVCVCKSFKMYINQEEVNFIENGYTGQQFKAYFYVPPNVLPFVYI